VAGRAVGLNRPMHAALLTQCVRGIAGRAYPSHSACLMPIRRHRRRRHVRAARIGLLLAFARLACPVMTGSFDGPLFHAGDAMGGGGRWLFFRIPDCADSGRHPTIGRESTPALR
jgi:hypothetical protein